MLRLIFPLNEKYRHSFIVCLKSEKKWKNFGHWDRLRDNWLYRTCTFMMNQQEIQSYCFSAVCALKSRTWFFHLSFPWGVFRVEWEETSRKGMSVTSVTTNKEPHLVSQINNQTWHSAWCDQKINTNILVCLCSHVTAIFEHNHRFIIAFFI